MSKASLELGGGNWAAKDGKLLGYAVGDTSGKYLPREFDFTRGGDLAATRVNEDGLIEKYRENLLLQSNNFGETWAVSSVSVSSGESGYDGSSDAWLLSKSDANGFIRQFVDVSTQASTFSFYAKAGTLDWVYVNTVSVTAYFYLSGSGSVGTVTGSTNVIDTNIESVGNGWYRISVSGLGFTQERIYPADGNEDTSGTSGSIYIQDAQLEYGLVATDYLESGAATGKAGILDNLPRIDYTGGSASLLLEPSRTNKLVHSEYFDSWASNHVNKELGYLAPDGTYSAYKITSTDGGANSNVYLASAVLADDTRSIWARTTSGTGTAELLTYFGNTNNLFTITEEWQRFEISSVTTSIGETNFYAVDFRGGDGTLSEVIIWGAQAEEGSYPTSYIPTYGVSATRNEEFNNLSFTGIETEGTVFGEIEVVDTGVFGTPMALSVDDNTNNFVLIYKTDVNRLSGRIRFGGVDQALLDSGILTEGYHKFALKYKENDCEFFVDGVSVATDTSVSIPTNLNVIRQYIGESTNLFVGGTKQLLYFPTALTDSECIALTTL